MLNLKFCAARSMSARLWRPTEVTVSHCRVQLEFRAGWLAALAIQPVYTVVHAAALQELFTVGDIRVEGLRQIAEGTVFNYLPVNIGDHLDGQRIGEAMLTLHATGFFRDVKLRRDGNTLLVVVIEHPPTRADRPHDNPS
jgi:outer membrane protein assembly factor BamA